MFVSDDHELKHIDREFGVGTDHIGQYLDIDLERTTLSSVNLDASRTPRQ